MSVWMITMMVILHRLRGRENAEKKRAKEHLNKRMHTLLTLKSDINTNRVNLKGMG